MDTELDQLGERIAEQAAHLDAATHRLLVDLREFDERGGWWAQGALSCAHWLSWRVGWTLATARDRVRVANKLPDAPAISNALRRGEVSYSKVRAMLRAATPANESLLLDYARLMTASQLEQTCRKYALVLRHGQDPHPLGDLQRRYVRRRDTEDGMVKIEAVLHPEEAELVWTMLTHAATQLTRTPESSSNNISAETPESNADSSTNSTIAEICNLCYELYPRNVSAETQDQRLEAASSETTVVAMGDEEWHSARQADERPSSHSLLDRLLDEDELLRAGQAAPGGGRYAGEIGTDPLACLPTEVRRESHGGALHQRANAARRAFNRADALVALAQGYLRGDRPNRSPVEVTLTIPASSLRADSAKQESDLEHSDGLQPVAAGEIGASFVSCEAARRLSCDCGVIEVIEDDNGVPLSVGRKRRTISGPLKRALHGRDKTCTFPGCTNRLYLEGHHIKHWADGGETSLNNAALLCTTHHHHVHEYGYTIELDSDQRPRFRDPHGRLVTAVPAPSTVTEIGWPKILAANEPLAIRADTNACKWDGHPVDYGAVIGYLVTADGLN